MMVAERPIPVLTESEEEPPMEPMYDGTEPEVYWIVPRAWEDALAVQVVRGVPLRQWLAILREWGMEVVTLPYQSAIAGGPADGGRVVAVEADNGRHYFALPPAALPALRGLVSAADYDRLLADVEEED
jgi:hypothetical protein